MKTAWVRYAFVVACGMVLGVGFGRAWDRGWLPAVSAQEARRGGPPPLPTMESLPAEVAQLKALVPSNSHIMMDVQFHWTNLWFAGRKKNWPLALYFFNESRGHITWLIRKSPVIRGQDGKDVDIKGIFDGVDTADPRSCDRRSNFPAWSCRWRRTGQRPASRSRS